MCPLRFKVQQEKKEVEKNPRIQEANDVWAPPTFGACCGFRSRHLTVTGQKQTDNPTLLGSKKSLDKAPRSGASRATYWKRLKGVQGGISKRYHACACLDMEGVPLPPLSLYRGAADEMGKCQTFHKEKFHTGLAGSLLRPEREKGATAHPTLPTAGRWQAWSCSCHFVWLCGSLTTLRAVEVAGSAEAQPLRELSVSWARGLR
jgi:hypothetical protein